VGISVEPPGPSDPLAPTPSLVNKNVTTGPAAGAGLATIAAPPAGIYKVDVYVEYSGTVAAADQDNLRLQVDSVTLVGLLASAAITSGDVNPIQSFIVRTIGTNIRIQAVALATATAVYTTMLVATQVG